MPAGTFSTGGLSSAAGLGSEHSLDVSRDGRMLVVVNAGSNSPPPEKQPSFATLRENQADTDRFMGTIAGTTPIPEFLGPENLSRIVRVAQPQVAVSKGPVD